MALGLRLGRIDHESVAAVYGNLIAISWVRLLDINEGKFGPRAPLFVDFLNPADRPAKRGSGATAKNENPGFGARLTESQGGLHVQRFEGHGWNGLSNGYPFPAGALALHPGT